MAKLFLSLSIVILPILFSSVYSEESLVAANGQKTWCVSKPTSNDTQLMENLEYVCRRVDCHVIQQGGPCFHLETHLHHASVAMNLYYQSTGRRNSSCDFRNSGLISLTDPSLSNCTFQSEADPLDEQKLSSTWCVAKPGTSDEVLQQNLDFACSHVDCSPTFVGGKCYDPPTLINHASFAMNLYYQSTGSVEHSCDFRRTGLIVTNDPSYGICFYEPPLIEAVD